MNININKKLILVISLIILVISSLVLLYKSRVNQLQTDQNKLLENNQTVQQLSNNLVNTISNKEWTNFDMLNCKSGDGDNLENNQILKEFT